MVTRVTRIFRAVEAADPASLFLVCVLVYMLGFAVVFLRAADRELRMEQTVEAEQ